MNQMSSNTQEASMKRENASYVGRPAPEELVPSRYAVQIGEIEVLVISDGVLPLPTAMLGHKRRPGRPCRVVGRHVSAAGRVRLGAERRRGP